MTGFFDRLKNIAKTLFRHGGLIYTPIAILAFFAPATAHADIQQGLSVTVWDNYTGHQGQFNNAPPIPPTTSICLETTWSNLIYNFNNNPVCGIYDDFIVNINGYITAPETGIYTLYMHGDDGVKLYLDDSIVVNAWYDSGNAGGTTQVEFTEGVSKSLTAWYYENGGGAQVRLDYLVNGQWVAVPDSWFSQDIQTPPTTTIAPYLNAPQNIQITSITDSSISLSWDIPEQSNTDVEHYAVMWSCDSNWDIGWGISSYETDITINGLDSASSCLFQIRADNDTLGVYSNYSQSITGITETTTTTTTTTTSTTTIPETTTTWVPDTTSTVPPTTSITTVHPETVPVTTEAPTTEVPTETTIAEEPETTPTTEAEVPVETSAPEPEQEGPDSTVSESTEPPETTPTTSEAPIEVPEDVQDAADVADVAVDEILASSKNIEELSNAVDELVAEADTPEELVAVIDALLGADLTDEQFDAVIDSVFSEPLTDENFSAALDAVFEEPLSDEQFDSVITAILDEPLSDEQFEKLVSVLESDSVSEEQVSAAVDEIIANEISEEQAVDLATSAKVLESIDGDQATEIFDAVDISAVTTEEAAKLVSAVQDAPKEVKEAFETEINIFQGAIDTYVPLGSSISVGGRRVVVAVSAVIVIAPAPIISRRR